MSFQSPDAKQNFVFSRTGPGLAGQLSHGLASNQQQFLSSNPQSKLLSKESLASVEKKNEGKFAGSRSSNPSESSTSTNSRGQAASGLLTSANRTGLGSAFQDSSLSKQDFSSKEKTYQSTIEVLQRKIEQLSNENKKLSDSISNKSTSVVNKSIDEKEQRDRLMTILEEKEKIEKTYKQKIERLTDENSKLLKEVDNKETEIKNLEKKLIGIDNDNGEDELISARNEMERLRRENKELEEKAGEKQRKYEELEEVYKQKLSQFKKEIMLIKTHQQSQSSVKESTDNPAARELTEQLRRERDSNAELQAKIESLTKLLDSQKKENSELRNRVSSLEKDRPLTSNQKTLHFSFSGNPGGNNDSRIFSPSPVGNSRVGSFVKCNFEEFEEKINNLVMENESLINTARETSFWRDKCRELEERVTRNEGNESLPQSAHHKIRLENDELKRNLTDITSDNNKIKSKLLDLEKKFEALERDYSERMALKEEEIGKNYEKIIMDLEESKEKNINKISKENHELKQQNDELQKQIAKLLMKNRGSDSATLSSDPNPNPKTALALASPILIINEMTTPSGGAMYSKAKDPKTNLVLQQKTFGGLAPINENAEEGNTSSGETKSGKKPENLKKINSIGNFIGGAPGQTQNNSTVAGGTNNSINIIGNYTPTPTSSSGQMNGTHNLGLSKQNSLLSGQQAAVQTKISSSINSQTQSQIKIAEINQNRITGQPKLTDQRTQPKSPFMKETTPGNNSFAKDGNKEPQGKTEGKSENPTGMQQSQSRTDLKSSNVMNAFNPFKQQALDLSAKKEPTKDKKVIMFNLMESHKKMTTEGSVSGSSYASNK